ncbi:MAG: hypothetical protein Q4F03_00035 [Eubacteriales bacterium]|nr:hypothetical protein [Eubacteriales bacterium]
MKCKNCGTEFDEGLFCPECGTKCENGLAVTEVLREDVSEEMKVGKDAISQAYDILEKYDDVEEELNKINKIGWSDTYEKIDRARAHWVQVKEMHKLNCKTEHARNKIAQREEDLKDEIRKLERTPIGAAFLVAIVFIAISIFFLLPGGIIRKIFGVLFILAGLWAVPQAISENYKIARLKEEFYEYNKQIESQMKNE